MGGKGHDLKGPAYSVGSTGHPPLFEGERGGGPLCLLARFGLGPL